MSSSSRHAVTREPVEPLQPVEPPEPVEPQEPKSSLGPFFEGFLVNSLNPPVATFYLLILPQFVPPGGDVIRATLVLTAVHVSMALSWHVAWAVAGAALAARLREGRPRATLEMITGAALTALGVAILL
jgi:threonine/homoserine/homoserine lactone efflux protein